MCNTKIKQDNAFYVLTQHTKQNHYKYDYIIHVYMHVIQIQVQIW